MNPGQLVAAVIGSPVAHSLSPAMYRAVFAEHGIRGDYGAIDCSIDDLERTMSELRTTSIRGLSVTMPLKEAVISCLDHLSDTAELLQAVNCVVVDGGEAFGHNTDGDGCCDALHEQGGVSFANERCVVLGAGGTGRSVALALGRRGGHVVVINRTQSRTDELVTRCHSMIADAGGSIRAGTMSDIEGATVVVNTTSVGMNSAESLVPGDALGSSHVVLDAVYQPMETQLLASARAAGATAIDGLWMLVHQARRQCLLQFGLSPNTGVMRAAAEQALRERRQ